ncbi:MAG: ATP-dependent protease FtsH [Actinomycetota bacterium]
MGTDVVLDTMAKATPGMSGADLANLVNEAALLAVRRGSKVIEHIDFENARDRVIMGARRESLILNAEEKRATAYHEGGHAVLATVTQCLQQFCLTAIRCIRSRFCRAAWLSVLRGHFQKSDTHIRAITSRT